MKTIRHTSPLPLLSALALLVCVPLLRAVLEAVTGLL